MFTASDTRTMTFMAQASPCITFTGSRLVQMLTDMLDSKVVLSHEQFSEGLGRLVDLSGSLALSSLHGSKARKYFEPSAGSPEATKSLFIRSRKSIVLGISKCFSQELVPERIRLPRPAGDAPIEQSSDFEPYKRFYKAHQADMAARVHGLRVTVRDAMAGFTPELAQLAAFDATLGDSLSSNARHVFTVIPVLLEKRFTDLVAAHQQAFNGQQELIAQSVQPNEWLETFYKEMRDILLAELEVRLQPVLGLVEALNKEVEK